MPELSRFYGIVIQMYFGSENPGDYENWRANNGAHFVPYSTKMKSIFSTFLFLLCGYSLTLGVPTRELDPQLLEIYELMQSNEGKKELKGREFD